MAGNWLSFLTGLGTGYLGGQERAYERKKVQEERDYLRSRDVKADERWNKEWDRDIQNQARIDADALFRQAESVDSETDRMALGNQANNVLKNARLQPRPLDYLKDTAWRVWSRTKTAADLHIPAERAEAVVKGGSNPQAYEQAYGPPQTAPATSPPVKAPAPQGPFLQPPAAPASLQPVQPVPDNNVPIWQQLMPGASLPDAGPGFSPWGPVGIPAAAIAPNTAIARGVFDPAMADSNPVPAPTVTPFASVYESMINPQLTIADHLTNAIRAGSGGLDATQMEAIGERVQPGMGAFYKQFASPYKAALTDLHRASAKRTGVQTELLGQEFDLKVRDLDRKHKLALKDYELRFQAARDASTQRQVANTLRAQQIELSKEAMRNARAAQTVDEQQAWLGIVKEFQTLAQFEEQGLPEDATPGQRKDATDRANAFRGVAGKAMERSGLTSESVSGDKSGESSSKAFLHQMLSTKDRYGKPIITVADIQAMRANRLTDDQMAAAVRAGLSAVQTGRNKKK